MRRSLRSLVTLTATAALLYVPLAGCGDSGGAAGTGDDAAGDGAQGGDGTTNGDAPSIMMEAAAAEGSPADAPSEDHTDGAAPDADASVSTDAADAPTDAIVDAIPDAEASAPLVCVEGQQGTPGNAAWVHGYGDAGEIDLFRVAVDRQGNVFAFGEFQGTINFAGTGDGGTGSLTSAGAKDVFLAKFDANGNHLWSARYGDAGTQYAGNLTTDAAGNVYVTGSFYSGIDFSGASDAGSYSHSYAAATGFVAKFDSAGHYVWSREVGSGSGYEFLYGIADDGLGNVVVCGGLQGSESFAGPDGGVTVNTGAGSNDMQAFKLTEGGDFVWARHFGDSSDQDCEAVGTDAAGNVYLSGMASGNVSLGSAGTLAAGSSYDTAVIKLGPDGTPLWGQLLTGGADLSGEHFMAVTPAGEAYLAFNSHAAVTLVGVDAGVSSVTNAGGTDIVVAKFDAAGTYLWAQGFGDASDQQAGGIAVGGDGSVFVAGNFQGSVPLTGIDGGAAGWTSQGAWDAFVLKLDATGHHRWATAQQGPNDQYGTGIAVSGCAPVIAGLYSGNVTFAGGADGGGIALVASTASGAQGGYLATLNP